MSSKKIIKKDLANIEKNIPAIKEEDVLSPELMKMLEDKVPEFVKEYVADGTAILRWNHEFLIMLEEILRLDFGFEEDDMVKIEKRLKEMFPIIAQMKKNDTKLLRKVDFAVAIEMVKRNKELFKAEQAGITLPSGALKKLK